MVARETEISEGLAQLGLAQSGDPAVVTKLARLADLLESEGVRRGLVSARDSRRMLSRHILECAALQLWLPPTGRVADVGSGAGLPGLVLGVLREDSVLIEPMARRASFLREMVHELELATEVVADRAEVVARGPSRAGFTSVVARAVARPPVALELTLPLVEVGGIAALLIGSEDAVPSVREGPGSGEGAPDAPDPLSAAAVAVRELGGGPPEVRGFEVPGAKERRWVMIVRKLRPTPDLYPRSAQALRRRPLGTDVAGVMYRG